MILKVFENELGFSLKFVNHDGYVLGFIDTLDDRNALLAFATRMLDKNVIESFTYEKTDDKTVYSSTSNDDIKTLLNSLYGRSL